MTRTCSTGVADAAIFTSARPIAFGEVGDHGTAGVKFGTAEVHRNAALTPGSHVDERTLRAHAYPASPTPKNTEAGADEAPTPELRAG